MSDSRTGGKTNAGSKHSFFVFAKPYFDFIGEGKIFSIIYLVMAGVNCLLPFVTGYLAIDNNIFSLNPKITVVFVFTWLVIVFACWIGLQLWLDRRQKFIETAPSEFIATLVIADILQTFGEWLGTLIGIIGAGAGLTGSIFLVEDINDLFSLIGLDFMQFGPLIILIGPVIGFFIIIISRFLAEQLRLMAALVNNTKQLRFLSSLSISSKETAANLKWLGVRKDI
jgi:hypothetical protein